MGASCDGGGRPGPCAAPSPLPLQGSLPHSDLTARSFADSIGGPFPVTSHRCHQKQKHCPPVLPGGGPPATPLLFHPHTKGSQILMDLSHKAVKRQASFCNAITFSNRPVLIYEQVRLKVGPPSLLSAHPQGSALPSVLALMAPCPSLVLPLLPFLTPPRALPSSPCGTKKGWGRGVAMMSCHQTVGRLPEERKEARWGV